MALKKNEAVVRESAPAFIYYNVSVPIHYDHCHSLPDNEVSVLYLFTFNDKCRVFFVVEEYIFFRQKMFRPVETVFG